MALEAIILDKPVISTDIIGPRSILQKGGGLLVENSVHGLKHGMCLYLDGLLHYSDFDICEYQQQSIKSFERIIS